MANHWGRTAVSVLILLTFTSACSAQIYRDPRRKTTVGFEVDLEVSPDTLASIVQKVADDTAIRGTHIYAKDPEIDDADSATSSNAFPGTPGPGRVFYKVKTKALSPANFPSSNDMGTVTVRYIVEPEGPKRSRLKIDAVFISDGMHTRYSSDGTVETAEYAEIMAQLKALEAPPPAVRHAPTTIRRDSETAGLQQKLDDETARLAETKASEQKLRERIKQLEFNTEGRVKSEGVPLKDSPYEHSLSIVTLQKGDTVTVLTTTKYWYRIRTPKAEEGWIYYVFLEPLQ